MQNTKSKAGTLPAYAYLTNPPEASPLNFEEIISSPASSSHEERSTIYAAGTVVAVNPVNAPERLSDVVLVVFLTDLYEDHTEVDARIGYITTPLITL